MDRVLETIQLNKISFKGNSICIRIDLSTEGAGLAKSGMIDAALILRYRGRLEAECVEIQSFRNHIELSDSKKSGTFEGTFYLENAEELKIGFWDLYFSIIRDEIVYEIKVGKGDFNKKVRNPFYGKCCYWKDTNMFFYPYIKDDNIAFQYRKKNKYDTTSFRLKEMWVAICHKLFKSYWNKRNICLVFEKYSSMAEDNGYYFFDYCMKNDARKQLGMEIYYVIDKNSKDRAKLMKYKSNVIDFMSLKHMFYAISAKLLVSTDTKEHLYVWRQRHSILTGMIKKKPLVFLQHGVIALKDVRIPYAKGESGQCQLFITSSEAEKKIITKQYGYDDSEVAVTGLARWDVLSPKKTDKKQILVMATWRNWLEGMSEEKFIESKYFKSYQEFINSKKLENLDAEIVFYVHNKLRDYVKDFATQNKNVKIIAFGEQQLNEIIMTCDMLVTDYSSVSWDVFYQKKPVVFYQFDIKDYLEAHGSHIDMENELFGERTDNPEEVIAIIRKNIENGFVLEEKYEQMHKDAFAYVDDNNSRRILEAIKRM